MRLARSVRPLVVAGLVALHAAVALCGPGLHALPGWRHDSGVRQAPRDDHSHGPGKSSHQATEDCPVCHFLAQGQVTTDLTPAATAWLVAAAVPVANEPPPPTLSHLPSVARAPPGV